MDVSPLSTGALANAPAPPPRRPALASTGSPDTATPFSAGALAASYEHATAGQSGNTQWATYERLAASSSFSSTGGSAVNKLAGRLTSLVTRLANGDQAPNLEDIEHKVAHLLRQAMRDAAASGQPFSLDLSVHVEESAAVRLSTTGDGTQTDVVAAQARSLDLELRITAGGAAAGAGGSSPALPAGSAMPGPGVAPNAAPGPDGHPHRHHFGSGGGAFADLVRQLATTIQDALSKLNQPVQLTPVTDSPGDVPAPSADVTPPPAPKVDVAA